MSEHLHLPAAADLTYFAFARPVSAPMAAEPRRLKELPALLCGRYRIDRLLGVGGMGAVYQACDLLREQFGEPAPQIAIKTLNEDFSEFHDGQALLHSEYAVLSRLRHRQVVRAFSFEVDPGSERAFITMELLKGCTLDELLLQHPQGLPRDQAREIALALLEALSGAHEQGICHGDIKPGNLMLGDYGIRLFDFGLSHVSEAALPGLPKLARDRFAALTPSYAAPELLDGADPTPDSDVYAAACVIYELYQGEHPFQRLSAKQALERKLVPQAPTSMPLPVWKALQPALSLDSGRRDRSVGPLRAAFQKAPRSSTLDRCRNHLHTTVSRLIRRNGRHVSVLK